jgi:hypothetical protein
VVSLTELCVESGIRRVHSETHHQGQVLFRVVRYLSGDWRSAMHDEDRRAGVAQA